MVDISNMVSGPNKDPWPEALWTYDPPDTNTTVNLGDQGLSDGDQINSYLDALSDNTRVEIPAGEYVYDPTSGNRFRGSFSDLDVVGLGDIGDVRLRFSGGEADGREVNMSCDGGTTRLKNIWFPDPGEDDDSRIRVEADTTSSEFILEHVFTTGGSTDTSARSNGVYAGSDDHIGTLRLLWCWIEGRNNNGAYVDGYAGSGLGQVIIVGGLYKNNNIAQCRIGNDDSVIYRATMVHEGEDAMNLPSGRSDNGRGTRIRNPGDDLVVDECDIHYTDQGGDQNYNPFVFSDAVDDGSGIFTNSRIYTESSGDAIRDKDGGNDGRWDAIDIHITGPGSHSSDLTLEGESCTGSGCDIAHDTDGAWFGEDVDGGIGDPGGDEPVDDPTDPAEATSAQWQRKYTGEVDDFETEGLLDPYTVSRGSSTAFRRITPEIWPGTTATSEGGLLRPAGEGIHMEIQGTGTANEVESFPGEGLWWYPKRGDNFSFYYNDNDPTAQNINWSIRFFLEFDAGGNHSGYAIHRIDNEIRVREYINGSEEEILGSAVNNAFRTNEAWKYVEVQTDEETNEITVEIRETDGHPTWEASTLIDSFTFTDDRFNGRGIMIRGGSALVDGDLIWFDEWMNHSVDPPTLIENFRHGDLDAEYTRETDLVTSTDPVVVEDWESYTLGGDLEDENFADNPDQYVVTADAALGFTDSTQGVEAQASYVQMAVNDVSATQDDQEYFSRIELTASNDASGFMIHAQNPADPNAAAYLIRLDHRDQTVEIQDRGTTLTVEEQSYPVTLGNTYELWLMRDSATDILHGTVVDVDAGETKDTGTELTLGTTSYNSGAWALHGGRSGGARFDDVFENDPDATSTTGSAYRLRSDTVNEGTNSMQWPGVNSGFELLYGQSPEGLTTGPTRSIRGHYRVGSNMEATQQFRWAVDGADPTNVYYALEFDVPGQQVRLLANPTGMAEEELMVEEIAFVSEEFLQFRIEEDHTQDDAYVEVMADASGEEIVSLFGSHSGVDPTFGNQMAFYGEGGGQFWFDNIYEPGTTTFPAYVDEIDWELGGEPTGEPPTEPTDGFVPWQVHRRLEGGRGRLRALTWHPDQMIDQMAAGGVADTATGGDLLIYSTTGTNWSLIHDLPQPDHVLDLAYSPDGQWLAVPLVNGDLRIYETDTYTVTETFTSANHAGGLGCISWKGDGDELAVGTLAGFVYLYDTTASLPRDWEINQALDHSSESGTTGLRQIAYSPDDSMLGIIVRERGVHVYRDIEPDGFWDGPFQTFTDQGATTRDLSWNPDGSELAYTGESTDIIIRNTDTWAVSERLERPDDTTQHVDYSHTGRWIAATQRNLGPNGWTRGHVWEAATDYSYVKTLNVRSVRPWEIKFHPESSFLGMTYNDGLIDVFNAPKDTKVTFSSDTSMRTVLQRSLERSGQLTFNAGGTLNIRTTIAQGQPWWHLRFDGETVIADARSPETAPTWIPGETTTFTVRFKEDSSASQSAEFRYEKVRKYQRVNHASALRMFTSYRAAPRFDERLPEDAPINSLLIGVSPSAVLSDAVGCWGVITNVVDQSPTYDAGMFVLDLEVFVLASPVTDYEDHDAVRSALGVRGMDSMI